MEKAEIEAKLGRKGVRTVETKGIRFFLYVSGTLGIDSLGMLDYLAKQDKNVKRSFPTKAKMENYEKVLKAGAIW